MAAAWKHDEPRYVSLLLDGLGPDAREQALRERDFLGRSALYFALHKGYTKVGWVAWSIGFWVSVYHITTSRSLACL